MSIFWVDPTSPRLLRIHLRATHRRLGFMFMHAIVGLFFGYMWLWLCAARPHGRAAQSGLQLRGRGAG